MFLPQLLILGGGGIHGNMYIGALKALIFPFVYIKKWSGISIGSLVATLCVLGFTPGELEEMLFEDQDNVSKMFDPSIKHLLESSKFGSASNIYLREWICNLFEKKNINTKIKFGDLEKNNLDIIVTKVEFVKTVILNKETAPDWLLIDAIVASCSLPFVFDYHLHKGERYIDGGMAKFCYEEYDNKFDRILELQICPRPRESKLSLKNYKMTTYISDIILCLVRDRPKFKNSSGEWISIELEPPSIYSSINFSLSKEEHKKAIKYGFERICDILHPNSRNDGRNKRIDI